MELFDGSKIEDELKIPYSIEAEEALLGSIFIKPDAISEVIEIITAMDFYKNNYFFKNYNYNYFYVFGHVSIVLM